MIDRHSHRKDPATAEARYALRVAARLNEGSADLPGDITERLRFAREQALGKARAVQREAATGATGSGGALSLRGGWWPRLAAALPVLALAAGLVFVQLDQQDEQLRTAVEIDAALLADDLPPSAYTDAGFAEFLKAPSPQPQ
ncbi:MAG TPA: DUF3619 family protein [Methylibium sp.]|nr:DUF3619 family protein [Methylibium sp.]